MSEVEIRPIENHTGTDTLFWIIPKLFITCRRPQWEEMGFCSTGGNLIFVEPAGDTQFARCIPPDKNLLNSSLIVSNALKTAIDRNTSRGRFSYNPILEPNNPDHAVYIEEQSRVVKLLADHGVLRGGMR